MFYRISKEKEQKMSLNPKRERDTRFSTLTLRKFPTKTYITFHLPEAILMSAPIVLRYTCLFERRRFILSWPDVLKKLFDRSSLTKNSAQSKIFKLGLGFFLGRGQICTKLNFGVRDNAITVHAMGTLARGIDTTLTRIHRTRTRTPPHPG